LKNKPTNRIALDDPREFLKSLFHFIWERKLQFIPVFFLGAILGFLYAHWVNKIQFTGRLTFVLDKQLSVPAEEGPIRYSGVDVSGNPSVKLMNGDNLLLILQSDKIIKEALCQPLNELKGQNLLSVLWRKHPHLMSGMYQDSLIKVTIRKLNKSHLLIGKAAEMGSFYFIEMCHENELFCLYFPGILLESLMKFYEDEKFKKLESDIKALRKKVLYIKGEIKQVEGAWNVKKNQSRNLIFAEDQLLLEDIKKKKDDLELKLRGQLELLDIALLQQFRPSTFLHVIDRPLLPLTFTGKGRLKYACFFGFLSFLIYFMLKKKNADK
jgi:hypothetical protein